MKPAQIYQQYIWLINAFRRYRQMTLDELNEHWMREGVADGNPLPRTTFNRHRDAILDMFGVIIDCDVKDHYKYYIANPEVLLDDSLERWMLSTMTVGGVLSDSVSLKDRIILENVPAGEEYLETIISHHGGRQEDSDAVSALRGRQLQEGRGTLRPQAIPPTLVSALLHRPSFRHLFA